MIILGETLISEDIFEKQFICNIDKCKGACCIEGDKGAPVETAEVEILKKEYPNIKPFLSKEGIEFIEKNQFFEEDGAEYVTTCLPDGKCCFVVEEKNGLLSCGIEKAYYAGKTDFLKPISCHLYPIRISKYATYHAVNYHQWDICSDACQLGEEKKVPVYQFLENSLTRKFGAEWYAELKEIAEAYLNQAN